MLVKEVVGGSTYCNVAIMEALLKNEAIIQHGMMRFQEYVGLLVVSVKSDGARRGKRVVRVVFKQILRALSEIDVP